VSERHFTRLSSLLDRTEGNVVIGGKGDKDAKFMEPTVVTGVTMNDSLMQEELFGPILPIVRAESVEEAVKLINGRDKPLALYVFSGRDKVADLFKLHTSSGGLCINDTIMHLGVEELPFGGVGASGMGAYHGKHGFDTFTHYKPILKKDLGTFTEKLGSLRYPPYNEKTMNLLRVLFVNRSLPSLGWMKSVLVFGVGAGVGAVATYLGYTL